MNSAAIRPIRRHRLNTLPRRLAAVPFGLPALALIFLVAPVSGIAQVEGASFSVPRITPIFDLAARENRIIAVGDHGLILMSEDGGIGWTRVPSPVESPLTAVTFSGAGRVCAVGHRSTLLMSGDGGDSWAAVEIGGPDDEPPAALFDVAFMDGETGVAVGAFGNAWLTRDAGRGWRRHAVDADGLHLYGIAVHDGSFWAVGEAGAAYRSSDGRVWRAEPVSTDHALFGLAVQGGSLIAFGADGAVYSRSKGAEGWTDVSPPRFTDSLFGSNQDDRGRIFIAGDNGVVLMREDATKDFVTIHGGGPAAAAILPDRGRLILGTENGIRVVSKEADHE